MVVSDETRNLVLPAELVERVASWHGGQWTACYALCSTGLRDYVSVEMVRDAADELNRQGKHETAEQRADREDLVAELEGVYTFPEEYRFCDV